MKYSFIAAVIFLLLCSCATAPVYRFSVNSRSLSYPAGSVSAQADKLLSGEVQGKEVTVSYYPAEDAVCLEYRADFVTYYQFWSRPGREVYKTALERYKIDYEQRSLNMRSGRKERRVYGTVRGFLWWQVMQRISTVSDMAVGPANIHIGYSFKGNPQNKTPYFTITQDEAEYQDKASGGRKVTSVKTMLYFTRTQADELAALFDQEYLLGLSRSKDSSPGEVSADEY